MTDEVVTAQQIMEYRQRIQAGEELSEEELRNAWAAFRQDRNTAASLAKTKSRSSTPAKPVRSTQELTALFGNQETP